jgi:hypothetical protein
MASAVGKAGAVASAGGKAGAVASAVGVAGLVGASRTAGGSTDGELVLARLGPVRGVDGVAPAVATLARAAGFGVGMVEEASVGVPVGRAAVVGVGWLVGSMARATGLGVVVTVSAVGAGAAGGWTEGRSVLAGSVAAGHEGVVSVEAAVSRVAVVEVSSVRARAV